MATRSIRNLTQVSTKPGQVHSVSERSSSRSECHNASRVTQIGRLISEGAARPLPAYAAILALQLKVVWGMWWVRDLTTGDTAGYFISAYRWYSERTLDLAWSPLYVSFYGSFLYVTSDAYQATIAHRLVIVLAVALLVLRLMRQLLEPRIAWLMAAWWVVLPVNHDVLYEVHLFGVIPVLLATLVIVGPASHWRRGLAVSILLGGALFVRNELIVPTALLAAACALFEIRTASRTEPSGRPRLSRLLFAYGLPAIMVSAILPVAYYASSFDGLQGLLRHLEVKHTLNVCQIYAYGYQQRHPEWHKSPWLDCHELMLSSFGSEEPSMAAAFWTNPRAMRDHFRWNLGLIPSGLQVLLFNSTSGSVRPGYEPVSERSTAALALSVILGVIYLGGAVVMAREYRYWWSTSLQPCAWGWLTLLFASISCLLVMVTQRPRPAYLYAVELLLQAIAGLCLLALLRRWNLGGTFVATFPFLAVLLIAVVPSYYSRAKTPPHRPLLEAYRTLAPFRAMIQAPGTILVTPGYGFELCAYLSGDIFLPARLLEMMGLNLKPRCQPLDYYALRREPGAPGTWWPLLAARGATMFYANEAVTGDPEMWPALASAQAAGWEVIMRQTGRDDRVLLRRRGLDPALPILSGQSRR